MLGVVGLRRCGLLSLLAAFFVGCDDPCAVSCAHYGQCTRSEDKCIAVADDCRRSEECRVHGLCASRGGVCVAASADDCRRSLRCASAGICALGEARCEVDTGGCEHTPLCAKEGFCSEVHGRCRAVSDDDYTASVACRTERRCRARAWRCIE